MREKGENKPGGGEGEIRESMKSMTKEVMKRRRQDEKGEMIMG